MTTLSVLLPVYNGERYLELALDSVLAQTFRDFELLVIDDGSTDGTAAILQRTAARDARVRVITRENRGLVATLNELVREARGELLARMDADDIALPERFERQVAYLKANPEVVCVGGAIQMIDDEGRYLTTIVMPLTDAEIQQKTLAGHAPISHPCATMRREVVLAAGNYRDDFYPAEDLDLWLRLGELGQLANLPEPVLRYRLHGGSISGSNVQRQRDAARRCCESAWARRGITDGRFEAGEAWRPTEEPASQQKFALRYGWWAFHNGDRRTTLKYAAKAIGHVPFGSEGWRLLAVALCKPMRQKPS